MQVLHRPSELARITGHFLTGICLVSALSDAASVLAVVNAPDSNPSRHSRTRTRLLAFEVVHLFLVYI